MPPIHRPVLALGLLGAALAVGAVEGAAPFRPRADLAGDALPPGARARYGSIRLYHSAHVDFLTFSRDGKLLASLFAFGGSVLVWDVTTGRQIARTPGRSQGALRAASGRGRGDEPRTVAFGPDSTLYFFGDSLVWSWDYQTGSRRVLREQGVDSVTAGAVAPDGKTVAVGLASGTVVLLDSATGAERAVLPPPGGGGGQVFSLAFGPDGKRLAVCSHGTPVRLWDVPGKTLLHTYPHEPNTRRLQALRYSPDGKYLAVLRDGQVCLLETAAARPVAAFREPPGNLAEVRFSPDGKRLLGLGAPGTLFQWDVPTGKEITTKKTPWSGAGARPSIAPTGLVAAVACGEDIQLLDVRTGQRTPASVTARSALGRARFLGRRSAVCVSQGGTLHFWDPTTGKPVRSVAVLPPPNKKRLVPDDQSPVRDLSADGKHAAVEAGAGDLRVLALDGLKQLWKAECGTEGVPWAVRFSPNGRLLAACYEEWLIVWDVRTGQKRLVLPAGKGEWERPWSGDLRVLRWSPDGRMLLVLLHDHDAVIVWEVATGLRRQRLEVVDPTAAAFGPDGRLAVSDEEGVIRTFVVGRKDAVQELPAGAVQRLTFSRDGSRLAAACDEVIRVWDREGRPLFVFRGHEGRVSHLAFAPDGRTLLSASEDGTALVWDLSASAPRVRAPAPAFNWDDLGSTDANRALEAMAALRERPAEAVAFLGQRLAPAKAPDRKRVERLLADLDGDSFATRRQAASDLEALGVLVESALRVALDRTKSGEARRRLRRLLGKLECPAHPQQLRELRAVEALERIGTREARKLLAALAKGVDARLTREARDALGRLDEAGGRR